MTDRTELRLLLEEATPGPWHAWNRGIGFEVHTEAEHNPIRCDPLNSGFRETFSGPDAHLIAAAVNALPTLLDALDAAEAALARVRELHSSSGTAESQGYDAEGEYGYIAPYCTGCEASDEYAVAWPCPTIRALGGEQR